MANDFNLQLYQGTDFERTLTVYDTINNAVVNLTNYTVVGKLKHSTIGANTTAISFVTSIYDAAHGKIRISLTNAVTALLIPGRYSYDVEIISPSPFLKIYRIVQGTLSVSPNIV